MALRRMLRGKISLFGLALTTYDIWRRLPPEHRRRLMEQARKHGPRIAGAAMERRRRRRPPS